MHRLFTPGVCYWHFNISHLISTWAHDSLCDMTFRWELYTFPVTGQLPKPLSSNGQLSKELLLHGCKLRSLYFNNLLYLPLLIFHWSIPELSQSFTRDRLGMTSYSQQFGLFSEQVAVLFTASVNWNISVSHVSCITWERSPTVKIKYLLAFPS